MQPDGVEVKLNSFYASPNEWGPLIQAGVAQAQLPHALAEIESGHAVDFGPFVATSGGVGTARGRQMGWTEISKISSIQGRISIRAGRGRPISAQVRRVRDLYLFLALAQRLQPAADVV